MLHGQEPYVLVQGQFDPPRRVAAHQIEQLLEGQFMAGGNPIQIQCSSARQMRWSADPGGGSVLGLDARVWGKSVSRSCRSAGTDR